MKFATRGSAIRILILLIAIFAACMAIWWELIRMPGESFSGPLPTLSQAEKRISESLHHDVVGLTEFGQRNVVDLFALKRTANWLDTQFSKTGYNFERQSYLIGKWSYDNVIAELPGSDRRDEIILIGAHYDTAEDSKAQGTVGANDNASGVAGLLALARTFAGMRPSRTVRFIAFVNEEPASFKTEDMGSLVYARRAREQGDQIVAMISLETIGYYSDEPGSQKYPLVLDRIYPDTGNFIGFVGNISSRELIRESIALFRSAATIPSEGLAAPESIPGVGWSDHWSFWQMGYPGIMVTDTAPFRYPHYHTTKDTPDKLDFERMGRVVKGLEVMVRGLSGIKGN
jgi:hypothetical protein